MSKAPQDRVEVGVNLVLNMKLSSRNIRGVKNP